MLRCAKAGVRTPCVYLVDQRRSRIYMEKVEGPTLKHFLRGRYDPATGAYDEVAIATVVRRCRWCLRYRVLVVVVVVVGFGGTGTDRCPPDFWIVQLLLRITNQTPVVLIITKNHSGSWAGPSRGSTTLRWCTGT